MSYEGSTENESRQRVGLLLSYYSDYLFSQVYDGIESALKEKGYGIEVAVTKNRLNDEAIYLEGLLKSNVSGLIIEGSRSAFPNPNIRLYREIRKQNIPTLFIHIFGRIPADTIIIKLYPVIGEALDKTLITLDPLHIIIFEYTANPAVSVLNQYFCQLICIAEQKTVRQ